jgi:hypothetical protein
MRRCNNVDACGSGGGKSSKKQAEKKKESTNGLALGKCLNCGKRANGPKIVAANQRRGWPMWPKPKRKKSHLYFWQVLVISSPTPPHQNRVAMAKNQTVVAWLQVKTYIPR